MPDIQYIIGDATAPQGAGTKIIVHLCNDIGGWGAGFVLAISKRWKQPEMEFRKWFANREQNDFALGAVQLVQAEPDLWVANVIGQHDIQRKGSASIAPPIRYTAVESGLNKVADHAKKLDASIHMPRIGCGLAGGKWEQIEPIVSRTLSAKGISVTVYDFSEPK